MTTGRINSAGMTKRHMHCLGRPLDVASRPGRVERAGTYRQVQSAARSTRIHSSPFHGPSGSPCETSTSMTDAAHVSARAGRRWSLGHPWIFRSDVTVRPDRPAGAVVVLDHRGKKIGTALWSPASEIALRMVDARPLADLDHAWWRDRIQAAVRRRAPLATCHQRVSRRARRGGRLPVARLRPLRSVARRAAAERRSRGVSRADRRRAVRNALTRRDSRPPRRSREKKGRPRDGRRAPGRRRSAGNRSERARRALRSPRRGRDRRRARFSTSARIG